MGLCYQVVAMTALQCGYLSGFWRADHIYRFEFCSLAYGVEDHSSMASFVLSL